MSPDVIEPSGSGTVIRKFNLRVAKLVRRLRPDEVVEILSGSESLLAVSNENQNQNQSRIGTSPADRLTG